MHNIKDIRQNPDIFKEELSKRFVNIDLKVAKNKKYKKKYKRMN